MNRGSFLSLALVIFLILPIQVIGSQWPIVEIDFDPDDISVYAALGKMDEYRSMRMELTRALLGQDFSSATTTYSVKKISSSAADNIQKEVEAWNLERVAEGSGARIERVELRYNAGGYIGSSSAWIIKGEIFDDVQDFTLIMDGKKVTGGQSDSIRNQKDTGESKGEPGVSKDISTSTTGTTSTSSAPRTTSAVGTTSISSREVLNQERSEDDSDDSSFKINPDREVPLIRLEDVINKLFNIAFWTLLVLSTFFFIMGAYQYLTATESNRGVSKAQKTIINAVIAIVIAILSKGLALYIPSLFGIKQ